MASGSRRPTYDGGYLLFMIFDAWLLTQWLNSSFYHLCYVVASYDESLAQGPPDQLRPPPLALQL